MIKEEIKNLMFKKLNETFKDFEEDTKQKLFEVSVNTIENDLNSLKEAIKNKDKEQILHFTHSIKGVFLNLQCNDLAEEFNDKKLKNLNIDEIIKKISKSIEKIT